MTITFLFPAAGWLLLLLPALWWPMRKRPRWKHVAVRATVFVCLILALMQPSLLRRDAAGRQVFILDQRPSLGAAGRVAARRALDRVVGNAPAGSQRLLIQLGGTPVPSPVSTQRMVPDGSLSTALAMALDAIPLDSGGAVTLVSDGQSTDRHWDESVAALIARGIPVNTIAIASAARTATIGDVRMAPARVGEMLHVETIVEGDGATHQLMISSGARRLAASSPFQADGRTRIVLDVPAERAGFLPLRVTLDGRSGFDTLAAVQDPLRLLYLGYRQQIAATMLQALLGRSFAVEQGNPAWGKDFDPVRWPLVLLDDLPAARFPAAAQQRLTRAVARDGTGLVVSGGMAAFGSGGYAGAPLGAALPVTAQQQDKEIRPSVALAIVIDSSGSMQGDRLELAKQVARQTVRKLTPNDWVGVVEFYGARQWSVPMHHAVDLLDVERSIGRMQAKGSSVLFPALQEAFYGLKDIDARYKHILVISDGGVAEDRYQQLLRHIAESRVNVSTVAVGGQVDDEKSMAEWARIGRGRFYSVPDEFNLVALDFKQPQTNPEPGYRSGSYAVRVSDAAGWWDGLRMTAIPPLSGYVQSKARPEAATLLRTDGGDPVVSSWQVGSGRVTAVMTEPFGAGTANWQRWPDYGRWLARILARTARQRPNLDVGITRRFDRLHLAVQRLGPVSVADAARVPEIVLLDAQGQVDRRVDAIEERAPGLFEADILYPGSAPARVEVRDGDARARAADAAASDTRPQDAMAASMAVPLAPLSARTGGWHRDDPAVVAGALQRVGGWAATELGPLFALLALLFYLFDLGYRRWPARETAPIR